MPVKKGRGKVLRHRRKKLPGNKFLQCDIMSKQGPRGGRTVCHVKRSGRKR